MPTSPSTLYCTLLCLACTFQTGAVQVIAQQVRPNILLIITDDQGYGDVGFHGNPHVKTPALDRLAEQSVEFTHFYVSPVCAPTRSSLLTGRYSLRTGVYDTYNGGAIMANNEITLAEILQSAGYRTGMFGKWHLGDTYPHRPQDQGFDQVLMHPSGGMGQVGDVPNYFRFDSSYFDATYHSNSGAVQRDGYCSDVFTNEAIRFIASDDEQPFFCYLSYNAPHTPLQVRDADFKLYQDLAFDHDVDPDEMTDKNKEDARRIYGMVHNIDDNIGRLLALLDDRNIRQNTIVIFMTDNGPQQRRYNAGLRGLKGTVYEGGTRVPFLLSYLPMFQPQKISAPAAHFDVLPSIIDLINLEYPGHQRVDGKSFLPTINGAVEGPRPIITYWQRGYPQPYRNVAVRLGEWKLVGNTIPTAPISAFELFNIATDQNECFNLVDSNPEKAEELRQLFDEWYADIILSSNLKEFPRIIIGSAQEEETVLNRNDMKKAGGIWAEQQGYGYWDIDVSTATQYNIDCSFRDELPVTGEVFIRIGTIQRSIRVDTTGWQQLSFTNVPLVTGNQRVESWFVPNDRSENYLPFFLTIRRSNPAP